jgi:flagellar biosynthesis/type III secretory pathway protein FliH
VYEYRVQFGSRLRGANLADPAEPLPAREPAPSAELPAPAADEATPPFAVPPIVPESVELPAVPNLVAPSATPDREPTPAPHDDWPRIEAALAAIDEQLQEIEQRRRESLVEMQQAAVELAVSIAARLVHEKIRADDFAVEDLVGALLQRCETSGPVEIHLHPADLELFERRTQGQTRPGIKHGSYTLVADGSLERGDCRVDAGDFGILSKLELQLSEMRQHLLECLDDAQVERRRTQTGTRAIRRFPDRRETA